ncbi:MAG: hypothetical protein PVH44_05445, partial [Desulfobacterales bacterium]|jgi:uncharacterized membrane protein/glutaredoxin
MMAGKTKFKIMRLVAVGTGTMIALQIAIQLTTGSILCPNAGCKLVEHLTTISPLYLNILGLIYFLVLFLLLSNLKPTFWFNIDLIGLMLVSGLVFDAALIAYQIFVARTFCSYCLVIFASMMVLTLLYGLRQMAVGIAVLSAVGLSFSILTFFPMGAKSKTVSLKTASYGVKSCSSPTKEIYLIFSSDCPHCQKVIETLNNCNSCDLYLNPIDTVKSLNLSGLELNQQFSPEINRMILKVLAIDSVPVLVVKDAESYRFIRGEETIINFIRRACFTHEEVLYFDESPFSSDSEITVFTDTDEECSLAIDCDSNNASPTD